jgi:serine/threonine-protein kinase
MSASEPTVGDVLGGRYRLAQPLGRGGMGSVWRAEHLSLSSPVAVKLIHARAAESPDAQARFLREAQAAAALRSPHVVQVLDHGVEEGVPFIVMELLEGESLGARLARLGALSPAETSRIVTHVARAIAKAHEAGIVHRDLKPDNVFLVDDGHEGTTKVLDFGIAKIADGFGETGSSTHTGAVLGSPHYMSPEQARGTRAVDHRTDLWALGVIAFQCLTGRRPFEGAVLGDLLLRICAEPIPVPSAIAHVPPGFDAWFARATERDPDRRFQSATDLAESLRQLCGIGQTAPPASLPVPSVPAPAAPVPRAASSSPGMVVLVFGVVALLGALVVAAAVVVWFTQQEPAPTSSEAPVPSAAPEPQAAPVASEEAAPAPPKTAARAPAVRASPAATTTATGATPGSAQSPAEKIQAAEQKVKEAQDKIKAAEEKLKGLEGR